MICSTACVGTCLKRVGLVEEWMASEQQVEDCLVQGSLLVLRFLKFSLAGGQISKLWFKFKVKTTTLNEHVNICKTHGNRLRG